MIFEAGVARCVGCSETEEAEGPEAVVEGDDDEVLGEQARGRAERAPAETERSFVTTMIYSYSLRRPRASTTRARIVRAPQRIRITSSTKLPCSFSFTFPKFLE